MNRCAAVRVRGATDQCPAPAMRGHSLCGRHARTRAPVLWASLHRVSPIVRIQSLVRGWLIRRRLALAGPGVLCRKDLVNDEDLFTCESKDRHFPFEYFAFEEGGKVYWFNAESLWVWMVRDLTPVNPYTKTPLSNDVRKRLREWGWKNRITPRAGSADETIVRRWTMIVQIFRENGFTDTHTHQFAEFDVTDFRMMFVFLERDLQVVLPEKDIHRARLFRMCRYGQKLEEGCDELSFRMFVSHVILRMLSIPKDPYILVFSILSAFMRC